MSIATVTTRIDTRAAAKDRAARDWYVEPPEAVLALFRAEPFRGSIYDPACGRGTIPGVARGLGFRATGTDVAPRDGSQPRNFLLERLQRAAYDNVVCNPPFKDAEAFIERALDVAQFKVAMLLRLAFLESRRRAALFARTPLARVHVFSDRISMPPGEMMEAGTIEAKGGAVAFAWFVWEHGHSGAPALSFITARAA